MTVRHPGATRAALALSCATAILLSSGAALADQPTLTILEPTGTVYLASFPAVVPVSFRVNHTGIDEVNVLNVEVDGVSIIGEGVGNPFHGGTCENTNKNLAFNSCNVDSASQATVGLNWSVPVPGSYSLTVSVKHRGLEGEDLEEVQFLTLNAEYPAPPAVANKYMNANPPKTKVRGCVISAIAELHAKDSYYGPKGGPYNDALIRADVDEFRGVCGG